MSTPTPSDAEQNPRKTDFSYTAAKATELAKLKVSLDTL
jgi:hypothetical protein